MRLLVSLSLAALANAAPCHVGGEKFEAWYAQKNDLWDFSNHVRYNFDNGPVVFNLQKHLEAHIGNLDFDQVTFNSHDGAAEFGFQNPNKKKRSWAYPFKFATGGGASDGYFYIGTAMDRSKLKWNYANKFRGYKDDGFKVYCAYVFTWLYISHDNEGNCLDGTGNSYQMLVMIGNAGKTRVAFNYGNMAYPATISATPADQPRIGWKHHDRSNINNPMISVWESHADGLDGDDCSTCLSHHTMLWDFQGPSAFGELASENGDIMNNEAMDDPYSCSNVRHCQCENIVDDPNVNFFDADGNQLDSSDISSVSVSTVPDNDFTSTETFNLGSDYRLAGRCSLNSNTTNYGDYHNDGRHHICYVMPISTACSHNGGVDGAFMSASHPKAHAEQRVKVQQLYCAIDNNNINAPARWQRVVTQAEHNYNKYANKYLRRRNRSGKMSKPFTAPMNWERTSRPTENMDLGCGFSCPHPDDFPTPTPFKKRNFNMSRGGTWSCQSFDGTAITAGDPVPKGGWCQLTCPSGGNTPVVNKLRCTNWSQHYSVRSYNFSSISKFMEEVKRRNWSC